MVMPKSVDPAEFLWLMQHENRLRLRLEVPKKKKRMATRIKKTGCGTEEDDEKLRKRGWTKVGCGVWKKRVR